MKVNGVDIPNNVLQVQSGTNITVDSTDNTRPIVNLTSPLTGIVISGLSTFADNASASALATGTLYRTSTGILMVKY